MPQGLRAALLACTGLLGGVVRELLTALPDARLRANPASTEVSVHDLVISAGREYQKRGLLEIPGEFGQPYYEWMERELLGDGETHG
jgi:hypothetical protein